MVVDDVADVTEMIALLLKHAGYRPARVTLPTDRDATAVIHLTRQGEAGQRPPPSARKHEDDVLLEE